MRVKVKTSNLTMRDHIARSGKFLSWLTYAIIATVLIVFGIIHIIAGFAPESPLADFILPEIFKRALEKAQDAEPGEQGDYFNFLIGVPLAAAGSAVAAVVAASAKSVANRQRIVQEMDLVDNKLTGHAKDFLALVNAIDDLHERGAEFQRTVGELWQICADEKIHVLSVVKDDVVEHEGIATEGERVSELRAHYRPIIEAYLESIRERCNDVFDGYQVLTFDPFWARTIEIHGEHLATTWYKLEMRMRQELGRRARDDDDWSPRAISRQLRQWTLHNNPESAVMAFFYLPDDATPLEFVGAVIRLSTVEDEFPRAKVLRAWRAGDETPIKILNLGAASLFTLFRALPSQDALRATVFSLFPNLDTYESRGYFSSLPDKRRITNDEMLDTVDRAFEAPGALVYLQGMSEEKIYYRPDRVERLMGEGKAVRKRRHLRSVISDLIPLGRRPSASRAMVGDTRLRGWDRSYQAAMLGLEERASGRPLTRPFRD